jgi:hypothetical protein
LLTLVSILKLLAEVALLSLAGRFVLAILAGHKREQNLFYQVLEILTRPVIKATRFITPRIVIDRHVPFVTFMLLLLIWAGATVAKISICVQIGVQQCQ